MWLNFIQVSNRVLRDRLRPGVRLCFPFKIRVTSIVEGGQEREEKKRKENGKKRNEEREKSPHPDNTVNRDRVTEQRSRREKEESIVER